MFRSAFFMAFFFITFFFAFFLAAERSVLRSAFFLALAFFLAAEISVLSSAFFFALAFFFAAETSSIFTTPLPTVAAIDGRLVEARKPRAATIAINLRIGVPFVDHVTGRSPGSELGWR